MQCHDRRNCETRRVASSRSDACHCRCRTGWDLPGPPGYEHVRLDPDGSGWRNRESPTYDNTISLSAAAITEMTSPANGLAVGSTISIGGALSKTVSSGQRDIDRLRSGKLCERAVPRGNACVSDAMRALSSRGQYAGYLWEQYALSRAKQRAARRWRGRHADYLCLRRLQSGCPQSFVPGRHRR